MTKVQSKTITKIKAILIMLVLLCSGLFVMYTYASTVFMDITSSKYTVSRGEKITVKAAVQGVNSLNGGFNGYSGKVDYNDQHVALNSSKSSISGWTIAYNVANDTFVGSDPTGMDFKTNDITIIDLEFTVLETAPIGKSTINFSEITLSDKNYRAVSVNSGTLEITITENRTPIDPPKLSKDNTLKNLTSSIGKLSPAFSPNISEYTMDVSHNEDKIKFTSETNDKTATISAGNNEYQLQTGRNEINIVVQAEDGSKKTYTVVVNREKKPEPVENDKGSNDQNNNNNDKPNDSNEPPKTTKPDTSNQDIENKFNINISGFGNMKQPFSPDHYMYESYVSNHITHLDPQVTLESMDAKYEIIGNNDLEVGDNQIKVVVTLKNGEKQTYIFNVKRLDVNQGPTLSSISIGGFALNPGFNPYVNFYQLVVSSDTNALGVSASPTRAGSTINVTGHDKLKSGVNLIKVTVDEDYEQNTYVIEVIKEAKEDTYRYLPWIIILAMSFLVILLIVILALKKRTDRLVIERESEQTVQQLIGLLKEKEERMNNYEK